MSAEHVLALCIAVFVIAFLWGEHDGRRHERSRQLRRRINRHTLYMGRKDW